MSPIPAEEVPAEEVHPPAPLAENATPELIQRTGKGALFFQVMFSLLLLAAIRSFALKNHWLDRLPPLMLGLIGLVALVGVTLLRRDVVVRVTLGVDALVLHRRSGKEESIPLGRLLGIRRDIAQDMELAYLLMFEGDRLLRLRPPERDQPAPLQTFVVWVAERAGLQWEGVNAVPPTPPAHP